MRSVTFHFVSVVSHRITIAESSYNVNIFCIIIFSFVVCNSVGLLALSILVFPLV